MALAQPPELLVWAGVLLAIWLAVGMVVETP